MSVNDGQPNVLEKLGAFFGLEGKNNAAILAGDERDLSTAEKDLLMLAGPILSVDASQLEDNLLTWAKGFLATLTAVTSIPTAAAAAKAALVAEGGALLTEAESMAEAVWQAFIALALNAIGKVVPPATAA